MSESEQAVPTTTIFGKTIHVLGNKEVFLGRSKDLSKDGLYVQFKTPLIEDDKGPEGTLSRAITKTEDDMVITTLRLTDESARALRDLLIDRLGLGSF